MKCRAKQVLMIILVVTILYLVACSPTAEYIPATIHKQTHEVVTMTIESEPDSLGTTDQEELPPIPADE